MYKIQVNVLLKYLKILLITLLLFFGISTLKPLEVHASYESMTENDPMGKGSTSYAGGISYTRTGWTFYLLDLEGGGVMHPHAVTSYGPITTDAGDPLPSNNIFIKGRRGSYKMPPISIGAPWGPPFDINANFRGDEVREWLMTTRDDGHTRAAALIANTWGTEYAKQWENKELVLVFEPFMWYHMHVYNEKGQSVQSGRWICATSYWLGLIQMGPQSRGEMDEYGTYAYKRYTNGVLPNCMVLHPDPILKGLRLDPAPHGGYVTNNEMAWAVTEYWQQGKGNPGWGMGLVYCDVPAINTYDKNQGSPGPAEDPKPDKVGTKTIVKGYYTENETTGEKTSDGVYIQKDTTYTITIMDETEYKVERWDISSLNAATLNPIDWRPPSVTRHSVTPGTVSLKPKELTLYVLLKKVEAEEEESQDDWILEESEITKSVETGDKLKDKTITVTLPNLKSCNGHSRSQELAVECSPSCPPTCTEIHTETSSYTAYCASWTLSDKKFSLITKNTNEDDTTTSRHVLAKDGNFEVKHEKNPSSDDRSGTAESTKDTKGYNYKFVIHRLNKDKLSLLKYEPSPNDISKIQTLGSQYSIKTLDTKSRLTRKTEEYMEKLKLILEVDFDKSTDLSTTASGDEGCSNSKSISSAGNTIEFIGDVTIKTYSGVAREPDGYLNTAKISSYNAVGVTSGRMVQSGGSVTFNPFIKMTYQTLGGPKQEVYVISEWVRQIIPNDYAEISWNLRPGNLRLTSNQWSTHADAMRLKNEIGADVNSMLPGGAVYSLDMKNSDGRGVNPQIVTLKTYQTIVEGKARQYSNLKDDSTTMTEATAKDEHKAFVENAAGMLDSTLVEMWVNTDTGASAAWSSGGIKVGPGADITALHNGSTTASSDTKYYLSPDADNRENASRSDLDVKVTDSNPVYHRVWSDTSGNIRYTSGSSLSAVLGAPIEGGTVILTKGQGASALGGAVKTIDNRTGFVTKYVAAVERNTGNDRTAAWAPDGKWYNEAYYGIVVMEQTSQIEVKFYATDMRTTVMDPKLIPQITKKNEPMRAFMFQYKTALPSDAVISTFKGKAVYMRNADLLFQSQKAYIISQTVQDLS